MIRHPRVQVFGKAISLVLLAGATVGCASHPDKIDAIYVSSLRYQSYTCDQIALEMDAVERRTDTLYQELRKTRRADNWQAGVGVLLLPTLFALEGGDGVEASEYAFLKGDYEALRYVSTQKLCGMQSRSPDEQIQDALSEDTLIELPNNIRASLSQIIGLLERAQDQGIITAEELAEAQDTAFRLLGSNAGELSPGALDSLYAIINKTDIGTLVPHGIAAAAFPEQTMPKQANVESIAMDSNTERSTPFEASESHERMQNISVDLEHSEPESQAVELPGDTKTVAEILQNFRHLQNLDIDELPQWKLVRFFEKAGLPGNTPVLGFVDTSVWRSGKNGVLFTQDGIYYTNDFVAGAGGTYFMSYDEIVMYAAPLHKGRYFYIGYDRLPKRGLIDFVGANTDLEEFAQLISEIKLHYELHQEYLAGSL